jgi:hypothetical protein
MWVVDGVGISVEANQFGRLRQRQPRRRATRAHYWDAHVVSDLGEPPAAGAAAPDDPSLDLVLFERTADAPEVRARARSL